MKRFFVILALASFCVVGTFLLFRDVEGYTMDLIQLFKDRKVEYTILSVVVLSLDSLLPIPSTLLMHLNGMILGVGIGSIASFAGQMGSAWIGYLIGSVAFKLVKSKTNYKQLEFLERYGIYAVAISRCIPVLSESISIVCGYQKYNRTTFIVVNAIAFVPICLTYSVIGKLGSDQNSFWISFGFTALLSVFFFFYGQQLMNMRKDKARNKA